MPPKDEDKRCLTADRAEDIPLWNGYLLSSYICWKYGIDRVHFLTVFRSRGLVSLDSGKGAVTWAVKPGKEARVQEAIMRAWFNAVVKRIK